MDTKTDFDWVARIIDSCSNEWHFQACQVLISLFETKYQSVNPQAADSLKSLYIDKQIAIGALPH